MPIRMASPATDRTIAIDRGSGYERIALTDPAGTRACAPYSGLQFFGEVNIDARSLDMTVDLRDL